MRNIRSAKRKIGKILEIPREITSNIPKITIVSFDQLMIENYKGIIEYEEYLIKISTEIGLVIIEGEELSLNQINENDILVSGDISKIYLEKTEED